MNDLCLHSILQGEKQHEKPIGHPNSNSIAGWKKSQSKQKRFFLSSGFA
jgi:hypothetical protein